MAALCARPKETRLIMIHHITAGVLASSLLMSPAALAQSPQTPPAQTSPAPQPAALNLNTATKADLEKLPGVGPAMAQRILDYRQKNGSFKKAEELMNVQGIGEKSFLKLKPLVTVVPPKTGDR
jgi:competence protein ComEA